MMKSQAAMEYLMTYGWAILVIAVVLAALYSLGIFNPNTFAPKASAGSCEVVRPFGPTTSTDVHLEGTCTNMLPKYVASFNGYNSNISIKNQNLLIPKIFTITLWMEPSGQLKEANYPTLISSSNNGYTIQYCTNNENQGDSITYWINGTGIGGDCNIPYDSAYYNRWYFVVLTYNGANAIEYLNNKIVNEMSFSVTPTSTTKIHIGTYTYTTNGFNGSIANIEIYNKSLSANQISALYDEGIGGDPIDLTNLVGWWPLNGNSNDYSGNNYNGKAFNVSYSSTWYRTYSAP